VSNHCLSSPSSSPCTRRLGLDASLFDCACPDYCLTDLFAPAGLASAELAANAHTPGLFFSVLMVERMVERIRNAGSKVC